MSEGSGGGAVVLIPGVTTFFIREETNFLTAGRSVVSVGGLAIWTWLGGEIWSISAAAGSGTDARTLSFDTGGCIWGIIASDEVSEEFSLTGKFVGFAV